MIRPVTSADAPRLAELWASLVAYHQTLTTDLPGPAANGPARYAKRILQKLDDPDTCALVAEEDGEVVGYVLGMIVDLMPDVFTQEIGGFLADIYVAPSHRRQGVGRALVNALQDWFRVRQVPHFDWNVAATNSEGIAFWRSIGGREVMTRMRADLGDE